jgi:hypothetical protein
MRRKPLPPPLPPLLPPLAPPSAPLLEFLAPLLPPLLEPTPESIELFDAPVASPARGGRATVLGRGRRRAGDRLEQLEQKRCKRMAWLAPTAFEHCWPPARVVADARVGWLKIRPF